MFKTMQTFLLFKVNTKEYKCFKFILRWWHYPKEKKLPIALFSICHQYAQVPTFALMPSVSVFTFWNTDTLASQMFNLLRTHYVLCTTLRVLWIFYPIKILKSRLSSLYSWEHWGNRDVNWIPGCALPDSLQS